MMKKHHNGQQCSICCFTAPRMSEKKRQQRRSCWMTAQSRRMNNDLSLLMVQWNSAVAISTRKCIITPGYGGVKKRESKRQKMCPIFIEWMMELMHGVTFETSRVTKSDSFPSVDWLQSDRHGKYHTHHRSAAKQINEEPPAHMADRLTQLKIIKNTVLLKSMPSV